MKYGETRSGPRSRSTLVLLDDPEQPADRGPEEHADPAGLVSAVERRVVDRLRRGAEREQRRSGRARRASFGPTTDAGSKPLTSAAIRTGNPLVSNVAMKSIPLRPATRRSHVERGRCRAG